MQIIQNKLSYFKYFNVFHFKGKKPNIYLLLLYQRPKISVFTLLGNSSLAKNIFLNFRNNREKYWFWSQSLLNVKICLIKSVLFFLTKFNILDYSKWKQQKSVCEEFNYHIYHIMIFLWYLVWYGLYQGCIMLCF